MVSFVKSSNLLLWDCMSHLKSLDRHVVHTWDLSSWEIESASLKPCLHPGSRSAWAAESNTYTASHQFLGQPGQQSRINTLSHSKCSTNVTWAISSLMLDSQLCQCLLHLRCWASAKCKVHIYIYSSIFTFIHWENSHWHHQSSNCSPNSI